MAVVAGAAVAGVSALVAGGIQAYMSNEANENALKEARRAEKLRIKFAEDETRREESRFGRTLDSQKEIASNSLDFQKDQAQFQNIQSFLTGMNNTLNSNSTQRQALANSFRRPRRRG